MKNIFIIATAVMALCAPAQAATVTLQQNDELRFELNNVSSTTLNFSLLQDTPGYSNFGGYVKWSTRKDGRQDTDGLWGDCLECGNYGGSWALAPDGTPVQTIDIDFSSVLDTVYVWVRAT